MPSSVTSLDYICNVLVKLGRAFYSPCIMYKYLIYGNFRELQGPSRCEMYEYEYKTATRHPVSVAHTCLSFMLHLSRVIA